MPFAQLTSKVQHTMVRLASLVVLLLCSCVTSATWPALPRFATQSPKSGNQIDEDASANEDLKLLVNVLQEEKALLGRVANNERARVHHLKKELTKLKADHEQEQLRSQEVFESEMDAIFSQYEADKVLQEKQIIEQLTSKHNAEIEGITQKLSAEKAEALKAIHNEIDRLKAENALLQLSNSELKNELSSSISHMSKLAMASAEENDRFSQVSDAAIDVFSNKCWSNSFRYLLSLLCH
jgi:chromosome segregation ATPase